MLAVLWTFTDTWFDWLTVDQAVEKILPYNVIPFSGGYYVVGKA